MCSLVKIWLALLVNIFFQNVVSTFLPNYYSGVNRISNDDDIETFGGYMTQNGDVFILADKSLYKFTCNPINPIKCWFNKEKSWDDIDDILVNYWPSRNDVFYVWNIVDDGYRFSIHDMNTLTIKSNTNVPYNSDLKNVRSPCMKIYNDYLIMTGLGIINGNNVNIFQVFNFNTSMWLITSETIEKRDRHTCEILNGKMYLFGGLNVNSIESYDLNIFNNPYLTDISSQLWSITLTNTIMKSVYGSRAITAHTSVHIIGGQTTQRPSISSTFVFTDAPSLEYGNSLPIARSYPIVFFIDNRIFVFGGYSSNSEDVLNSYSYSDIFPMPLPTTAPTTVPTAVPTTLPSTLPSTLPTLLPSTLPTYQPSQSSKAISESPTLLPTNLPSLQPSIQSTNTPTIAPSKTPSHFPPSMPYFKSSFTPSLRPSSTPSQNVPTISNSPTITPSINPSILLTLSPTINPIHHSDSDTISVYRDSNQPTSLKWSDEEMFIMIIAVASTLICCTIIIIIRIYKTRKTAKMNRNQLNSISNNPQATITPGTETRTPPPNEAINEGINDAKKKDDMLNKSMDGNKTKSHLDINEKYKIHALREISYYIDQ